MIRNSRTRRCDEAVAAEQRLGTETTVMLWLIRSNADLGLAIPTKRSNTPTRLSHSVTLVASRRRAAQSLSMSTLAQALQGDAAGALPAAEEVVSLAHRLANPHLLGNALAFAAFALADSDPERSLAIAREAVGLIRPSDRSLSWGMAGDVAARRGDPDKALRYMARAIEDAHWLGNRFAVGNVIGHAGTLSRHADPEVAAVLLGAGEAIVPGYSHSPGFIEARSKASQRQHAGARRRSPRRALPARHDHDRRRSRRLRPRCHQAQPGRPMRCLSQAARNPGFRSRNRARRSRCSKGEPEPEAETTASD